MNASSSATAEFSPIDNEPPSRWQRRLLAMAALQIPVKDPLGKV